MIKSYFYFQLYVQIQPRLLIFRTEHFVVVQQSVTLNCGAEGNPPPTYTWTPCDSEQVCDKNALDISQVCEDVSYTCNVANGLGSDTKTTNVGKLLFSLTYLMLNSRRFFALSLSHFKGKCDLMMIFFLLHSH